MHFDSVSEPSCQPLNLLVVEDDLLFNALYQNFLLSKGATVHTSSSLEEAEQQLQQHPNYFDAVILDNQLPDGQGLDLLPKLNLGSKITAVIMVSGNDDADFFLTAFSAGIHDYMVKPVNLELLWLKVTRSVREQQLVALTQQQKQALEFWVEQEQHQQVLAKYLFDRMFREANQTHAGVYAWLKPHGCFSGDAILRCQGADGSWYILLADAMGHGLAPAISLMPLLRTFQAMAGKSMPLPNIAYEVNQQLVGLLPDDRFVAAALIRINPWQQQVEVWNGGLPAVLFLSRQGELVHKARSEHMALGVLAGSQFSVKVAQFPLQNLGYMVLFSDGLTETVLEDGSYLSEEQLIANLQLHGSNPLDGVTEQFQAIDAADDISLCLVDLTVLMPESHPVSNTFLQAADTAALQANFVITGAALAHTDFPAKVLELLKEQQCSLIAMQKCFTVLTELYLNALEHGVLELDSALKHGPDGFVHFYEEKEQRLAAIKQDAFIELSLCWSAEHNLLQGQITDSGPGFKRPDLAGGSNNELSGRGLALVEQLTTNFELVAPGNCCRFSMSLAH